MGPCWDGAPRCLVIVKAQLGGHSLHNSKQASIIRRPQGNFGVSKGRLRQKGQTNVPAERVDTEPAAAVPRSVGAGWCGTDVVPGSELVSTWWRVEWGGRSTGVLPSFSQAHFFLLTPADPGTNLTWTPDARPCVTSTLDGLLGQPDVVAGAELDLVGACSRQVLLNLVWSLSHWAPA